MIDRCHNPKANRYRRYGGRGITVCDEWRTSFDAFVACMGARPPGMTLDRIDNDRGYAPGNCRWADNKTQIRNSTTAKVSEQDVRDILRLVHEEGVEVHMLDIVYPLSANQIRLIALGKSYQLDGYAYPGKLPRRSDAKQYREGRAPKLDPDKVREIRRLYADGVHINEIAVQFGVTPSNAYNVTRGYTWRYVT